MTAEWWINVDKWRLSVPRLMRVGLFSGRSLNRGVGAHKEETQVPTLLYLNIFSLIDVAGQ